MSAAACCSSYSHESLLVISLSDTAVQFLCKILKVGRGQRTAARAPHTLPPPKHLNMYLHFPSSGITSSSPCHVVCQQ